MIPRAFIDTPYGNKADALEYLKIGSPRFDELKAQGIIKSLGRDWFFKDDLDEVGKELAKRRASDNTIQLHEGKPKERRAVDGSDTATWEREKEEFLRTNGGGSGK